MSTRDLQLRLPLDATSLLAWLSVAALGCGAGLGYVGVMSHDIAVAVTGAVLAGGGLLVITGARWIDPLLLLVYCLPMPALYTSDTARVAPALLVSAMVCTAWLFGRALNSRPLP